MGAAGLEVHGPRGLGILIPRVLALTTTAQHWPPLCGPASLCVWTSPAAETPGICSLVTTDAIPSQSRLGNLKQSPLALRHAASRCRGTLPGAHLAASSRGKPQLRRASAVLAQPPLNRRSGADSSRDENVLIYIAWRWRSLGAALHVCTAHFLHMAQGGYNNGRRVGPWPGLSKVSARSSNGDGRIQANLACSHGWLVDYTAGARLGAKSRDEVAVSRLSF